MTQAILNATTVLRGLIDSNRFVISTGTLAISVAAASTPFITNNRINVPSGTAPITAAAGFVAGNVYSAANFQSSSRDSPSSTIRNPVRDYSIYPSARSSAADPIVVSKCH